MYTLISRTLTNVCSASAKNMYRLHAFLRYSGERYMGLTGKLINILYLEDLTIHQRQNLCLYICSEHSISPYLLFQDKLFFILLFFDAERTRSLHALQAPNCKMRSVKSVVVKINAYSKYPDLGVDSGKSTWVNLDLQSRVKSDSSAAAASFTERNWF